MRNIRETLQKTQQRCPKSAAGSTQLNKDCIENRALGLARKRLILPAVLTGFTILATAIMLFAMTTAWYSNVVNTGGLVFEAQSWGFEGEVAIQEDAVTAAPGDSGLVWLKVTNQGETPGVITVNVTRQYMDPEQLQKRIYFYADRPTQINGEMTDRQYLTDQSGYTSRLYSGQSLILSDQIQTDVPIKWEWVYDVLGYYVRVEETEVQGAAVQDAAVQGEEGNTATELAITEYLRPIIYDYDKATFDENGLLETVDGVVTVKEYLAALTATDGYEGAFTLTEAGELVDQEEQPVTALEGYYPISTREDHTVWLYLCSKAEIEENTRWDTQFGQQALEEGAPFQARIRVSATQLSEEPVIVNRPEDLAQALTEAEGGVVQLENNMTLSQPVVMTGDTDAVLDLNGYSLKYTGEEYAFTLTDGDRLTVTGGTLTGKADLRNNGFYMVGGQLTLSDITADDLYKAVNIEDHKADEEANSFVRIVGCELTTEDITVKINGDGSLSKEQTHLVVQDSVLVSEGFVGILGNGNVSNPGQWGTDIQIINSEVTGYYAAVYHPQGHSTLTITGSTLSGMTGMAIKGGEVYLSDSTVTGTGTDAEVVAELTEEKLTGNGWLDTGDGVYVESDYEKDVYLEISGDSTVTATAASAYAVRVFPENEKVSIRISGGTFSHDVSAFVADGCTCSGYTGYYEVQ